MGGYGPHTQVKCLISGTCKKNIITYSQMRFQLYQLHSLTVTALKNDKKSKYWVSVGILDFIYLFGVLCRFQHCTGHITTGS